MRSFSGLLGKMIFRLQKWQTRSAPCCSPAISRSSASPSPMTPARAASRLQSQRRTERRFPGLQRVIRKRAARRHPQGPCRTPIILGSSPAEYMQVSIFFKRVVRAIRHVPNDNPAAESPRRCSCARPKYTAVGCCWLLRSRRRDLPRSHPKSGRTGPRTAPSCEGP